MLWLGGAQLEVDANTNTYYPHKVCSSSNDYDDSLIQSANNEVTVRSELETLFEMLHFIRLVLYTVS